MSRWSEAVPGRLLATCLMSDLVQAKRDVVPVAQQFGCVQMVSLGHLPGRQSVAEHLSELSA
jgi:hypothetical protein